MTETTATRSKISVLELVYPPMSNQESIWLAKDSEVVERLRQSDFYMIVGRAEARFETFDVEEETGRISFRFVGDAFSDSVVLNPMTLSTFSEHTGEYQVEIGPKLIRFWAGNPEDGGEVIDWFTTEKLLWERSRGRPGIEGFDLYRDAATYDLLYVGIAKVGDSFDRLFKNGHTARTNILANEPQRSVGARVTDETYLLLFRVEPIGITSFDLDHEFTDEDLNPVFERKRIVADAEKAFVHLLDPEYNNEKFRSYPRGKDGLYGSAYGRYGYNLIENLTLKAPNGDFKGGRDARTNYISNAGDSIFVEGDVVRLLVSGVSFSADYAEQVRSGLWDAAPDDTPTEQPLG